MNGRRHSPGLRALAAAAVLTTGLGLAGCSSDSAGDGQDAEAPAGAVFETGGDSDGGAAPAEESADRAQGERPAAASAAERQPGDSLLERAVISTGEVALRTRDVSDTRADVHNLVRRHRGHIESDSTRTDDEGMPVRADLVLRIPTERFPTAVGELEGLAELVSSSVDTEDVTTAVIDVETRVRAQRRALERLEALLDEADSLNQIIRLESELTRRQSDLASLEQQQEWLGEQTSMSTITVVLRRTDVEPEPDEQRAGFGDGLSTGWTALVVVGTGLLAVVGFLLPWLPVLALAVVPLWLLTRRLRRRPAAPAAAEQPDGQQAP